MALKKVRGNIERMFDKNLTDLVRGIRNSKENEVCANDWEIKFKETTRNFQILLICYVFLYMQNLDAG